MASAVADKVHQYFTRFPRRTYPKGQILVFADENPEHIFYVSTGKVCEYGITYRGDEVIVNIFKAGAFFPMSWAINRSPNHFFYKTDAASELHIVPVDDALNFLTANSDVMLDLLSRIYRGTEGLLGRMMHLMSGTAKSRLIYELLIECRRFGKAQNNGSYVLEINEGDLAARAGMSRETISREMRKLKQQRLAAVSGKQIIIRDLQALEQTLGADI